MCLGGFKLGEFSDAFRGVCPEPRLPIEHHRGANAMHPHDPQNQREGHAQVGRKA